MVINRGRRSKTKNEVKSAQNVKKISRFQWLFKWQVRCKKKLCYLVSYFIIHNSFLLTSFSNPVNKNQFRKSMYVWWSKQFFYHINFYMLYNLLVNFLIHSTIKSRVYIQRFQLPFCENIVYICIYSWHINVTEYIQIMDCIFFNWVSLHARLNSHC